jgi:CO/xanthine dehydrogenase Mo-binding subunit
MLWLRVVRATRPHARLRSIDVSHARRVQGVACVLTAADIPGQNRYGLIVPDQPILCDERVRYVGEPLAIVAADSDEIARKAQILVKAEYEELPLVDDPLVAEKAAAIHSAGNLCAELRFGQNRESLPHDKCSASVDGQDVCIDIQYVTNRQEHAFLETEAGTSWIDENGLLTISAGAQNPFNDRRQIAAALGIQPHRLRVLNPMMGGAFGGKEDCNVQILLALVTYKTGRPARLMFDRTESFMAGVKRHSFSVRYRVGATRAGRLKTLEVDIVADAGAYTTLSPAVIAQAAEHASGPYRFGASSINAKAVFTNNGNASAFRGFGNPQVAIGIEQSIDELARRTGLNPFEIRRNNLISKGQTAGAGHVMRSDTALPQLLDAAERGSIWTDRDKFRAKASRWRRRGVGVSAIWQGYGLGVGLESGATVCLSLTANGRFCLRVGSPDLGQGNITAFLQIASDELNCAVEAFDYVAGDSAGPESGSSHASRTIFVVGNAVRLCASDLRAEIITAANTIFDSNRWTLRRGRLFAEDHSVSLQELCARSGDLTVERTYRPVEAKSIALGVPHLGYTYWVQVMAVEVDGLTGEISVAEVENYLDSGRTINPIGAEAQCEGAFAQGLGYSLYENSIYDGGYLKNPTLSNYVIPSIKDIPANVRTKIFETPDDTNPLGVRGIAEIGLTPVAATVANALRDAIGVRFSRFPILPEMVLEALGSKGGTCRSS